MNRPLALVLAIAITGCSNVKPLVIATHISDPSASRHSETTTDFIGAGATVTFGGVAIEGAVGRKAIDCSMRGSCSSTLGGMATIRWSPK